MLLSLWYGTRYIHYSDFPLINERLACTRYFAIHVGFQFLVFPCFLSLYSWGRAASSERTIAIIVCMFCCPFVFAHGCVMTREFR